MACTEEDLGVGGGGEGASRALQTELCELSHIALQLFEDVHESAIRVLQLFLQQSKGREGTSVADRALATLHPRYK